MPKLEDLELKIKQTSVNTKGIKNLTDALRQLSVSTTTLNGASQAIERLGAALKSIDAIKATALANTARGMASLFRAVEKSSASADGIKKLGWAIEAMIDNIDIGKLSDISSALSEIKKAASGFQKIAVTSPENLGSTTEETTSDAVSEVGEAAASSASKVERFKNALKSLARDAANDAVGILKNLMTTIKALAVGAKYAGGWLLKLGKSMLQTGWDRMKSKIQGVVGTVNNLFRSFARIAMYRALRTAIKAITTGFSEGIKHVYQWAQQVGDKFTSTMDSMATSAHYLRDSLGAMASPLLDALAPAIDALVEKFVGLLNVVNQFIAAFTGQSTWRKAVKTPTQYSGAMKEATDNTRKATKAQKELNKALQGFDELNVITTNDIKARKPTSGGGADSPEVSATEFVNVPVADWVQEIKDSIEKGDWAGAGKLLADKLNSIVEKWDAKKWGNNLGQKVENGLKFYLGFMDNFKFEDLGSKIAAAFAGITEKISAEDMGKALVAHVKAAVKLAKGFFTSDDAKAGFEWIGTTLGVAFNELFSADMMNSLGETIGGMINDAIAFAASFITTADFAAAGENIMSGLFTAIETIDWATAGDIVGKLATGLLDAIIAGIDYAITHIDVIFQAIFDFLGALLSHIWEWLTEKFGGLIKDFFGWLTDNLDNGNEDEGNNRKDGAVSMTPFDNSSSSEAPVETSYTAKVKLLYESDSNTYSKTKKVLDKLAETKTTKFEVKTKNYQVTKDKITKISGNKTVTIYAKKDKDSFKTVSNAIDKISIDRTATIKFKPVIELSAGKSNSVTLASAKQFSFLVDHRANGGYPDQGSLFVAGEVPGQTEMVGNINGRTGVASGAEITGIADAVYNTGETEAELLRQQNNLLRQILSKGFNVNLAPTAAAGKWVNQATTAYARATG